MLQFNPDKRPSAQELLENKIFDKVRFKRQEMDAPYKIQLNVDFYEGFDLDSNGTLKT